MPKWTKKNDLLLQNLFDSMTLPSMVVFVGWKLSDVQKFIKAYPLKLTKIDPCEPTGAGFTATVVRKAGVG